MALLQSSRSSRVILSMRSASRSIYMTPDQIQPQRDNYNSQLKELRKQWAADYQAEQLRISEEKAAHIKRMILQKAIHLREKKAIGVRKAEAARVLQAKIRNNYQAHVARLTVLENQKNEFRKQRFSRLVDMLTAESKYWITSENMEQKITIDLFLKPSTTGVITGVSEHWRYHCPSMQPNRVIQQLLDLEGDQEEDAEESDSDEIDESRHYLSPVDYLADSEPYITKQKENIKGMLNAMIGTGDDREKYDDLVKDFIGLTETYNGPLTNLGKTGTFASEDPPDINKLSKQDFSQFFSDPDDPVLSAKIKSEIERVWSEKSNSPKDRNLTEEEIAYRAKLNASSNSSAPLPSLPSVDSDEEIPDDEEPVPAVAPLDGKKESKFAVADSLTIDDLIEDVDYVDENNMKELRRLYEKIRMKSLERK